MELFNFYVMNSMKYMMCSGIKSAPPPCNLIHVLYEMNNDYELATLKKPAVLEKYF